MVSAIVVFLYGYRRFRYSVDASGGSSCIIREYINNGDWDLTTGAAMDDLIPNTGTAVLTWFATALCVYIYNYIHSIHVRRYD